MSSILGPDYLVMLHTLTLDLTLDVTTLTLYIILLLPVHSMMFLAIVHLLLLGGMSKYFVVSLNLQ